jgi:GLPGLI family protein
MIRFILAPALLLLSFALTAQITSGTIDYLEVRTFPMWEGASIEMKKRMQEARERGDFDRTGRLSFNQEAFAYSPLPKEAPKGGGRGSGWMMRQAENPDVFYTSLIDSSVTDRRQIMDRGFIMQDSWTIPEWEVPENQKSNMAYTLPSELAFAVSPEGDTLTAYFTRSIPVGIGPRGYGGLPGAIVYLKVEKDGRATEYTMQTMKPNPADLNVVKPEEGDVVDREKFEKIEAKRNEARERQRRGWQRGRG